jgi:hypothetical protein
MKICDQLLKFILLECETLSTISLVVQIAITTSPFPSFAFQLVHWLNHGAMFLIAPWLNQ